MGDTVEYIETWQPTPLLRWLRVTLEAPPVLEQQWRSSRGAASWRMIEQVDAAWGAMVTPTDAEVAARYGGEP